jgi:ferredoxin-NADP reductase
VFVCGPDDWMDAACDAAVAAGVPEDRLHVERFTW